MFSHSYNNDTTRTRRWMLSFFVLLQTVPVYCFSSFLQKIPLSPPLSKQQQYGSVTTTPSFVSPFHPFHMKQFMQNSYSRPSHSKFLMSRFRRTTTKSYSKWTDDDYADADDNASRVMVTDLSPSVAEEMGIRDWPQQFKPAGEEWTEVFFSEPKNGNGNENDMSSLRYILDGTGSLLVMEDGDESTNNKSSKSTFQKLEPGTLVTIRNEFPSSSSSSSCTLRWKAEEDMIILTPNFEQGALLAVVAVAVIVIFGALLAFA